MNIPIVTEEWIDMSIEREKKLTAEEMENEQLYIHKPVKGKGKRPLEGEVEESPAKKTKLTYVVKGRAAVDPECENGNLCTC